MHLDLETYTLSKSHALEARYQASESTRGSSLRLYSHQSENLPRLMVLPRLSQDLLSSAHHVFDDDACMYACERPIQSSQLDEFTYAFLLRWHFSFVVLAISQLPALYLP